MNLEAIADKLQAASVGVKAQNIFINAYPAGVTTGLLLVDPFGGTHIDHELPGYRKGSFQIISRSRVYQSAKLLIDQAVLALTLYDTTITDMAIKFMRPRHDPFPFPVSQGDFVEFVVNIDVAFCMV